MTEDTALRPAIWVDEDGFVRSPSGAKLARVDKGMLYLWDKRAKEAVPVTPEEILQALFQPALPASTADVAETTGLTVAECAKAPNLTNCK